MLYNENMGTKMTKASKKHKGFTLIEMMIAVGIIAILAVTVILVINPANLLKEGRDSQRIADLNQMNRAMSLYIANVGDIPSSLCASAPTVGSCYVGWPAGLLNNQGGNGFGTSARCGQRYSASQNNTTVTSTSRAIDGTGWIPLDLGAISVGVPITSWPMDPRQVISVNAGQTSVFVDTSQYYSFACYNGAWEFTANMESARFSSTTTATLGDDVESTDNGTTPLLLEVGTNVAL